MGPLKKKKRLLVPLVFVFCTVLLAGCGGSKGASTSPAAAAPQEWDYAEDNNAYYDAAGASAIQPDLHTDRKMVYEASLEIESKAYDQADAAVRAAVEDCGGYIENTSLYGTGEEMNRCVNYTARIPVEHYRQFLDAVSGAGNLLRMQESADDITSSYIDVDARIRALEMQRDRLNELARAAETTADLLEIESQLSDVQYQLENYLAQMRAMDNEVAYSTVRVSLSEVTVFTPTSVSFLGQLNEAFGGGLDAFLSMVKNLVLAVVYLWPFLILAAVIIVLLRLWRKKHPKAPRHPRPAPPPAGSAQYPYSYNYAPPPPPQPPVEGQNPPEPPQ